MPSHKNPLFRRAIIPWYDSERVCWAVVGFMLAIAAFSGAGLSVALEEAEFNRYLWFPLLLLVLSTGIAISNLIRLFHRYIERISR